MKRRIAVVLCSVLLAGMFNIPVKAMNEKTTEQAADQTVEQPEEASSALEDTGEWNGIAKPSEAELIYSLEEPFYGDGNSTYVDTGVKLYDGSMDQWIVMACISNDLGEGDNVFFSCFSEEDPYRGLLFRNPTGSSYEFICGMLGQQWVYGENAQYFTVAIQRNGDRYRIFYNGTLLYELESEEIVTYDGNLLIGCEEDAKGRKFRFGHVDIAGLRVYQGTQSPSITASMMEEMLQNDKMVSDERKETVLKDRSQEKEQGPFQNMIELMQGNGIVLFLLAAGFVIACVVVYILDRHKKHEEEE